MTLTDLTLSALKTLKQTSAELVEALLLLTMCHNETISSQTRPIKFEKDLDPTNGRIVKALANYTTFTQSMEDNKEIIENEEIQMQLEKTRSDLLRTRTMERQVRELWRSMEIPTTLYPHKSPAHYSEDEPDLSFSPEPLRFLLFSHSQFIFSFQ
jgi:hypothetical protein